MSELQAEYGSNGNVRFMNPEDVRMYDSEGNVVLCKCGKPAGSAAIGKEAMVAWCSECSPLEKHEAKLVYREVTDEQLKQFDGILSPEWRVNLKPTEGS